MTSFKNNQDILQNFEGVLIGKKGSAMMSKSVFYILIKIIYIIECKPNILFIMVDDLGYGNIGINNPNNIEINTPNIDRLIRNEGLLLNRHYVHYSCSPTRSAFQSGRLPVHVNTINSDASQNIHSGIPINMTIFPKKLRDIGGYSTHIIGKWDAGSGTIEQIPVNKGYNTSFGYLSHANTYYNFNEWSQPCINKNGTGFQINDLWENNSPAYGKNISNIYEEFVFYDMVSDLIDNYGNNQSSKPFFIMYSMHLTHEPNQIPKEYLNIFNNDEDMCSDNDPFIYPGYNDTIPCRSVLQSMTNLMDNIVGNITNKLKNTGLWNNTLVVFSGDNGGCYYLNYCSGNNYPLRGGKGSPFEGGIRTPSFVTGGYLPKHRIGQIENGLISIADWYATFTTGLNNIDSFDKLANISGLPSIDSLNMWDLITGKNTTSPRNELIIDENTLILNEYKLFYDINVTMASWSGVIYPNSSTPQHNIQGTTLNCSKQNPCLFNIYDDPTEHNNIASSNSNIVNDMVNRLITLRNGFYNNNETVTPICPNNITIPCSCWVSQNKYNYFYGPWAHT